MGSPPGRSLPPALPNEGAFAGSGTNVAVRAPRPRVDRHGRRVTMPRAAHEGRRRARGRSPRHRSPPRRRPASFPSRSATRATASPSAATTARRKKRSTTRPSTADGGVTWTAVTGLGGFRSVVAPVPGSRASWIAVGPSGADMSADDGGTWTAVPGDGYHAFSFAPRGQEPAGASASAAPSAS